MRLFATFDYSVVLKEVMRIYSRDKMDLTKQSVCLYQFVTTCYVLFLVFFSTQSFAVQEKPDPKTLVVRYTQMPSLIAGVADVPSLRIYSNGYVQIFYPDFMRQAGRYEVTLNQNEMVQLHDLLTDEQILAFDEGDIRKQMATTQQSRASTLDTLSNTSDVSNMTLDIFPGQLRSVKPEPLSQDKSVQIAWSGLKQDAQSYPEIVVLQSLRQIQESLSAIMVHPTIQKVDQ